MRTSSGLSDPASFGARLGTTVRTGSAPTHRKHRARERPATTIYAQVLSPDGGKVLACASTLDAAVKSAVKSTGNVEAATSVGKMIAEKSKAAGIEKVAFDRSGFKYHGRVKALADATREAGLQF